MKGELVPLEGWHIGRLALPDTAPAHAVREGLAEMLRQPGPWHWAAMLGERVAGVGGFIWLQPNWCWAALAPASWVTPMQWRPFFRPIFQKLEAAHAAGARLIETDVYGPFAPGHRLVMALGFTFERVKRGHDGGQDLWLTYARHRHVPGLPRRVERYRRLQHVEVLRHLCPDLIGPAMAADLTAPGEVA